MQLMRIPQRKRKENIVPMINIVFLLLIFFLISAQITPPDPFEVVLPEAQREAEAAGGTVFYISAQGVLAYQNMRGDAALAAVADVFADTTNEGQPLQIRADADVEAVVIARLLKTLGEIGITEVSLLTTAQ